MTSLRSVLESNGIKMHNLHENSLLPEEYVEITIDDLRVGESCFVNAKDILVDKQRRCFIMKGSSIFSIAGNVFDSTLLGRVRVKKNSENEYTMFIHQNLQYKWKIHEDDLWMSFAEDASEMIPITHVIKLED